MSNLIQLTKTTQALLTHYASSLAAPTSQSSNNVSSSPSSSSPEISDPLSLLKSSTTLLKSHTTTLSLLLINPPFTASAVSSKIGDVSSGALSGMVAAASYVPRGSNSSSSSSGDVHMLLQTEITSQVRGILACWSDVLSLVCRIAEAQAAAAAAVSQQGNGKSKGSVTEAEKQNVLSTTGVVWEACDGLVKLCDEGVVGLVVKKAEEYRAVLVDAIDELKEWGEDVADEDDDEDDDGVEASDEDEDEIFGTEKKLSRGDTEIKALLDQSVKKLKMVAMLYQALIKRRLKTFPASTTISTWTLEDNSDKNKHDKDTNSPHSTLNALMQMLKRIPETVDDIAGAFYDLDGDEAKHMVERCCAEAKGAVELVRCTWGTGTATATSPGREDEFTAWSAKWIVAFDSVVVVV